jgi:hypothetical protein
LFNHHADMVTFENRHTMKPVPDAVAVAEWQEGALPPYVHRRQAPHAGLERVACRAGMAALAPRERDDAEPP